MAVPPGSIPSTNYQQADQLPAGIRGELQNLLSLVADNKLSLGRHYADWSVGSPILESSVALAAMAQDELGHARSFYPVIRTFSGRSFENEAEERGWPSSAARPLPFLNRSLERWEEVIAANFLPDMALRAFFEASIHSTFEPLRQRAGKIALEEETHWLHAETWVRRMAADDRTCDGLVEALRAAWEQTLAWLGPRDHAGLKELAEAGILASGTEAPLTRFLDRVRPVLRETQLIGELADPDGLNWQSWNRESRSFIHGNV